MKVNKSYRKRLRTTPTGKLLARKPGQNHFNAKAPRSKQMDQKRSAEFLMKSKDISKFMQQ